MRKSETVFKAQEALIRYCIVACRSVKKRCYSLVNTVTGITWKMQKDE